MLHLSSVRNVLRLNGANNRSYYWEPIGSRIWEIDWYQNEWPWPLYRGHINLSRSCQPLRYIRRWISRKPLEIEAWFQRTTNRKWPMVYQMVRQYGRLSWRQLGLLLTDAPVWRTDGRTSDRLLHALCSHGCRALKTQRTKSVASIPVGSWGQVGHKNLTSLRITQ